MRKIVNKKVLATLILSVLLLVFARVEVHAASATISCNSSVEVNKPITITVNGSGVQWKLKLIVDGKVIATSSELENYESNKNISFSGTYTPASTGNKTVKLEGSVTEFSDGTTKTSFTSKTINVTPTSASGGNTGGDSGSTGGNSGSTGGNTTQTVTLKTLKINGTTYQNKLSGPISINVEGLTSISMTPTTTDGSSATIKNTTLGNSYTVGSGKSQSVKLEEGTNKITVSVSSGKVYNITIGNSPKSEEVPPNVEEPTVNEEKLLLTGLTVEGYELSPVFSSEVFSYKIEKELLAEMTELKVVGVANLEGAAIEVTGNTELKEGENTITILVKSADGTKTATYQIVVTKQKAVEVIANVEIPTEVTSPRWNNTQKILITVFTSIIAAMGIAYAVVEYKDSKKKKDVVQEGAMESEITENPYAMVDFTKEDEVKEDTTVEDTDTEEVEEEEVQGRTEELGDKKGKPKGKHSK